MYALEREGSAFFQSTSMDKTFVNLPSFMPFSTPIDSAVLPAIDREPTNFENCFGDYGNMPGQFSEISGVAVTPQGEIAVTDTNNHRIQIYDRDGKFKFGFGVKGKEYGQMLYPNR